MEGVEAGTRCQGVQPTLSESSKAGVKAAGTRQICELTPERPLPGCGAADRFPRPRWASAFAAETWASLSRDLVVLPGEWDEMALGAQYTARACYLCPQVWCFGG